MGHQDQKKKLRLLVRHWMDAHDLTVTETAARIGTAQGTLSNYLRGGHISSKMVDRILTALKIDPAALLDDTPGFKLDALEAVALVSHVTAVATPALTPGVVERIISADLPSLQKLPSFCSAERRRDWTRFVAIEVNAEQAAFMWPLFEAKAVLIIDRHCQRIDPLFKNRRPIYAIAEKNKLLLGYVSVSEQNTHLHVWPHATDAVFHEIYFEGNPDTRRFIVGRVCRAWVAF